MYSPKFTISNKILKNIGIIEACKEIIDHAPLLPYYERQFREEATLRTVHHGTHIEGNELNLDQAERVIAGKEVVARDRDIQEVINYRKVLDYINETQNSKLKTQNLGLEERRKTVDEGLIKKLHEIAVDKILPTAKAGVFRKTQVVVKNSITQEISFRPPPAVKVNGLIKDFIAFINSTKQEDIHPVLKSGIVHYELVRIHPFIDGNGRVARALATYILFLEDYDIRKFFSLEEYFDSDAARYYEALQSVSKNHDELTGWLEYFTEGLAIELSKIKERVERISIDAKFKEKLGGKPFLLTDRQLKIIEYIQKTGYLQNQVFPELFPMVSEDTILNELKGLISSGIIKKHGVTKGARYILG